MPKKSANDVGSPSPGIRTINFELVDRPTIAAPLSTARAENLRWSARHHETDLAFMRRVLRDLSAQRVEACGADQTGSVVVSAVADVTEQAWALPQKLKEDDHTSAWQQLELGFNYSPRRASVIEKTSYAACDRPPTRAAATQEITQFESLLSAFMTQYVSVERTAVSKGGGRDFPRTPVVDNGGSVKARLRDRWVKQNGPAKMLSGERASS